MEKETFKFCGTLFRYPKKEHETLNCSRQSDWGIKIEYESRESHPDIRERGRKMAMPIDHAKHGYSSQDEAIAHFYRLKNKEAEYKPSNLLYIIAAVLVVIWFTGFVIMNNANPIIHILLIIALISVLLRVIQGKQ